MAKREYAKYSIEKLKIKLIEFEVGENRIACIKIMIVLKYELFNEIDVILHRNLHPD